MHFRLTGVQRGGILQALNAYLPKKSALTRERCFKRQSRLSASLGNGTYVHPGIKETVYRQLPSMDNLPAELEQRLNFDGEAAFRSCNPQLWSLLAQSIKPFLFDDCWFLPQALNFDDRVKQYIAKFTTLLTEGVKGGNVLSQFFCHPCYATPQLVYQFVILNHSLNIIVVLNLSRVVCIVINGSRRRMCRQDYAMVVAFL